MSVFKSDIFSLILSAAIPKKKNMTANRILKSCSIFDANMRLPIAINRETQKHTLFIFNSRFIFNKN
jgi:hypothetical protein